MEINVYEDTEGDFDNIVSTAEFANQDLQQIRKNILQNRYFTHICWHKALV